MSAHAVRRDPRPKEMTAAMRLSDGGEEELRAVVARRTAMRILVLRFVDRVALILEVRHLRMSITVLSFLRWPIGIAELNRCLRRRVQLALSYILI